MKTAPSIHLRRRLVTTAAREFEFSLHLQCFEKWKVNCNTISDQAFLLCTFLEVPEVNPPVA